MDWEKWMKDHHIKLRGEIPHDNRPDEMRVGGAISGSEVETEVPDHAGATSNSNIQEPERKEQTH